VSQQWKSVERWYCAMLGTRRRGQVEAGGWASGDDCEASPWSIEIKHPTRAQLPKRWLDQVRRQSKAVGKPYLLINAVQRKPRMDAPVTMRFGDFLALAADAGWIPRPDASIERLERLTGAVDPDSPIDLDEHISHVAARLEEMGL
jgi:hypothetical protein